MNHTNMLRMMGVMTLVVKRVSMFVKMGKGAVFPDSGFKVVFIVVV